MDLTFKKGTFIEPLNEESEYALDQVWTDNPGTTQLPLTLTLS